MIAVKLLEVSLNLDFSDHGVFPRNTERLYGILTYPFIHSGWKHLLNNSTAILVLGTMLFYFYKELAMRSLVWIFLLSGLWLWLGGRANYHIGASGLVYGLFGFLFVSGIIRKHLKLMALSLLVVFIYGSLVWGVFPIDERISFEGHLFGMLAGAGIAVVFRERGPQKPKYSWELEEEEVPDWFPSDDEKKTAVQSREDDGASPKVKITYEYKKSDGSEPND